MSSIRCALFDTQYGMPNLRQYWVVAGVLWQWHECILCQNDTGSELKFEDILYSPMYVSGIVVGRKVGASFHDGVDMKVGQIFKGGPECGGGGWGGQAFKTQWQAKNCLLATIKHRFLVSNLENYGTFSASMLTALISTVSNSFAKLRGKQKHSFASPFFHARTFESGCTWSPFPPAPIPINVVVCMPILKHGLGIFFFNSLVPALLLSRAAYFLIFFFLSDYSAVL